MSATPESTASVMRLADIRPGRNPRRYFNPAKHQELVTSLKLRGLLQPILLRPTGENNVFDIVAGERRFKAAIEAFGADGRVPVVIRDMTDQEALEAAIDENDIRDDASETEQADAAVRVLAACQGDRAEVAARLGWSPSKLDRRLALAGLTDAVKLALDERRIKVGHAELLAAVPPDKQDKALDTILSSGIDVLQTRTLLMRMTQDLSAALFDKAECTTCPFNSATQRALFETHVDEGCCTNAGCFQLKTEAVERLAAERGETEPAAEAVATKAEAAQSGKCRICGCTDDRACKNPCSWTDEAHTLCDNPDCVAKAAQPAAPPVPASKPTPTPSSPVSSKAKVTAQALASKLEPNRKAAWRTAVAAALSESADHLRVADIAAGMVRSGAAIGFDQVRDFATEFEVDLRTTWRVDGKFLALLSKDEVKFVAQECGLVAHMGEKAFAKLLAVPVSDLITGLLHATGFDWAGRLPSAMTLDGKYSPPPAPVAETPTTEKD